MKQVTSRDGRSSHGRATRFFSSGRRRCSHCTSPVIPVVLPTVWDAWSAKLAVDAGFAALTVGSHPVADSIGKPTTRA